MGSDSKIDRALAAIAASLNDRGVDHLEAGTFQKLVSEVLAGELSLTVDDGGGLHDRDGARVGAVRRTPSGAWIAERQNDAAPRSDADVPSPPPQGKLRRILTKLKLSAG